MHVFLTGAKGLIGARLTPLLEGAGHQVTKLVRRSAQSAQERTWDPYASSLPPETLKGCDVLIHLAGESIADGRWTEEKKRRIRESRVNGTQLLAQSIAEMSEPPKAFITASAIGYYGDRGNQVLNEESSRGDTFLAEVCADWEAATDSVKDRTRVVHVRSGMVLASDGGALPKMLLPFRLGVGGTVGNGDQWWSWIAVQDSARLFAWATENDSVAGVLNGVSPNPLTNWEFTRAMGSVLARPTLIPLPSFAAKLALGQMADELLLCSARVVPEKVVEQGFEFRFPELEPALHEQLQK